MHLRDPLRLIAEVGPNPTRRARLGGASDAWREQDQEVVRPLRCQAEVGDAVPHLPEELEVWVERHDSRARSLVTREPTDQECRQYLHVDRCSAA